MRTRKHEGDKDFIANMRHKKGGIIRAMTKWGTSSSSIKEEEVGSDVGWMQPILK